MNSVLPYLKRLIRLCLDRLQARFVGWTKPVTPSLLLGTIADLERSKSELMAKKLYADKTSEISEICKTLHISRATLYRCINIK